MNEFYKALHRLKWASAVEATTLSALVFIAVPLKYLANYSVLVSILGPIHGMAFLTFIWIVINTASGGYLQKPEIWRLFIASVLPLGGFVTMAWIKRREAELWRMN